METTELHEQIDHGDDKAHASRIGPRQRVRRTASTPAWLRVFPPAGASERSEHGPSFLDINVTHPEHTGNAREDWT